MSTRTDTSPLDYFERLELALAWMDHRADQRDGFLSDSDLMDAADLHTTSIRNPDEDAADFYIDDTDRERLIADLYHLFED